MKAILSLALCAVAEATGKPAMELRLAPPSEIYPEVQAAIRALDAKREATQAQELAAIDAAGARSFMATAQDDVAVKVLPALAFLIRSSVRSKPWKRNALTLKRVRSKRP